jgi:hypothetical protein
MAGASDVTSAGLALGGLLLGGPIGAVAAFAVTEAISMGMQAHLGSVLEGIKSDLDGVCEPDDDEDDEDDDALELDPELVGDDHLVGLAELAGPDDDDPRRLLPEQLVAVLERELLLLPLRVRLEALVAAAEVVSTWADLVADQEKLLGHLVLSHAEPQAVLGHEALADRHAVLHAASGPGHSAVE